MKWMETVKKGAENIMCIIISITAAISCRKWALIFVVLVLFIRIWWFDVNQTQKVSAFNLPAMNLTACRVTAARVTISHTRTLDATLSTLMAIDHIISSSSSLNKCVLHKFQRWLTLFAIQYCVNWRRSRVGCLQNSFNGNLMLHYLCFMINNLLCSLALQWHIKF